MKTPCVLSLVAAVIFGPACATTPKWITDHVREVHFHDGALGPQIRVLNDPKAIEELLDCFRRATRVGNSRDRHQWTKGIIWVGERPERGQRLYDPSTGDFTRLDPFVQPVYRLTDADRIRVNAYFEQAPPNQPRG